MPIENVGYAAFAPDQPLKPWKYYIREPQADEILIKVMYCGICHTDIHVARSEWLPTPYPLVPGHEFVGLVEAAGPDVKKFKVGDQVGVGCNVGACDECSQCEKGEDQYCKDRVRTYSSSYRGERTYGGYGRFVVMRAEYALRIPENLPFDRVAPLLCAGITTYSPLKLNMLERGGLKVGVIGLGGLGHMGVQFAKKLNETNEVTVISRSRNKETLAKELGASRLISSEDSEDMKTYNKYFDYLLDTVCAAKDMNKYMALLTPGGSFITVGIPAKPDLKINRRYMFENCLSFQGSPIGGVPQIQEMIDFCAEKQILPMTELIHSDYINEAYERVIKSQVMFRFVINVHESHPDPSTTPTEY